MTEERLVLADLLEKAGDGDFLRAVAESSRARMNLGESLAEPIQVGQTSTSPDPNRSMQTGAERGGLARMFTAKIKHHPQQRPLEACGDILTRPPKARTKGGRRYGNGRRRLPNGFNQTSS
jgi:hypothetical protein